MIRRSNLWVVALVVVWAAIAIPYVAVGADDSEEYLTGVTATKLAVDAIGSGSWPFWNVNLGLGMPQPLRFHFITHPLAPLCLGTDCYRLLRSIASLHLLLGAIFMALATARFTGSQLLAAASALTFCLSSSVMQPMFTDEWPITAINESALPVMVYALLALGDAADRRRKALWTLVLGGTAGFLLSISLPAAMLLVIACVGVSAPALRQRLPWLIVAATITALMGSAQVFHIYEEFARTPAAIQRTDHHDFAIAEHLWSAFLRPLRPHDPGDITWWRTVFFGPVFASVAVVGAFLLRDPDTRPLRVGLLLGVLGFVVPPSWLFNVNTAQWTFRTEVNVFGILLAATALHRWAVTRVPRWSVRAVVVVHLCWIAVAVYPTWEPVFATSIGAGPPSRRRLSPFPGVAQEIASIHAAKPGRVMFGAKAYRALRLSVLSSQGMAANQLPMLGVPTLSVVAYGITTDDLYPMDGTLEGELRGDAAAVQSQALLDVLGVRYVVALADEAVAPGLQEIRRLPRDFRLYENPGSWPEAFFVETFPDGPVPRLPLCGHGRFLCADFSRYNIRRQTDPITIARFPDGLRLNFAPVNHPRKIIVTQWYRPGWTVTEGRAAATRVAEELVGLSVEPGEDTVTLRFRPRLLAALFALGTTTEVVVVLAIVVLLRRVSRDAHPRDDRTCRRQVGAPFSPMRPWNR